jgi:predicted branched-subunit amino acid permease
MLAALPPASAIFVFGVIYGSLAQDRMGVTATILSSLIIFSGSVQFTLVALLAAGAGPLALVAGAATLNLRNVVLGAVVRPRVDAPPLRRGLMAWFLTDEATGLAITAGVDASYVLVVAGSMFYVAWQLGTILGVLGASLDALRDAATAVFPVLFIGLAALACPSWPVAGRAVAAAVVAGLAAWLWPGSQGVVAVLAAVLVSIPGRAA